MPRLNGFAIRAAVPFALALAVACGSDLQGGGGGQGAAGRGAVGGSGGTSGAAGIAGAVGSGGAGTGGGGRNTGGASGGAGGRGGAGGGTGGSGGTSGAAGIAGAFGSGGAGTAGGGGNTGGASGGAGGAARYSCRQPMPVQVSSGVQTSREDTGFDRCQSGAIHRRAVVVSCPSLPPSVSGSCSVSCQSDADCVKSPLGVCAQAHQLGGYCGCFYGFCEKDADCGAGSICLCGGPVGGTCVPATCTSDASCAPGFSCMSSSLSCGGGRSAFACQSAADECLGDEDCPTYYLCVLQAGKRSCVASCIARP
jgi:hypothetical protein